MSRANKKRIATEVKAALRDAASRARLGAQQIVDMREAVAGSTHPDAIRVRKLLALADRAPTYADRVKCLTSAWNFTKDYVDSRGPSKGGTLGARTKKELAVEWQKQILHRVKRMLAAGRSDANIAAILASETRIANEQARAPRTVSRFVAQVRKRMQK